MAIIIGTSGNDILNGTSEDDTIYAYDGNDTLTGGTGIDTAICSGAKVDDLIADPTGSTTWIDRHNNIVYTQSVVSGETRLTVKQGDATVVIKGWSDGELGIVLGAGAPSVAALPPATSPALAGDLKPVDFDPDTAGIQEHYDSLGNLIVGAEAAADRNDALYDSASNDLSRAEAATTSPLPCP